MAAVYFPKPGKVVYASSSGLKLDGQTDQTAGVQAILDSFGSANKPMRFVLDGNIMLDTIYLWGHQHFDQVAGTLITKKPYPGNSGLMCITNKHWTLGTNGTGIDANIVTTGLNIDGNRRNGGSGAAFPNGGAPYV